MSHYELGDWHSSVDVLYLDGHIPVAMPLKAETTPVDLRFRVCIRVQTVLVRGGVQSTIPTNRHCQIRIIGTYDTCNITPHLKIIAEVLASTEEI